MKLVVGLGNPGSQYAKTRHNIGFMVVEQLAANLTASAWKLDKKMNAELAEVTLEDEKIILAKPQTYMNRSGESIQKIMQFYKIDTNSVFIIFDDLDTPFGKLKIRPAGSSGGHQGINSTIAHIGQSFVRVRIGISLNDRAVEPSEVYVLKPFNAVEQAKLPLLIAASAEAVYGLLTGDSSENTLSLL